MFGEVILKEIKQKEIISQNGSQGILKGIPSSSGISIGKAHVIEPETIITPDEKPETISINDEIEKFDSARDLLITEFREVFDKVKGEAGNVTAIIETNLLIINDQILIDSIVERIKDGYGVESAVTNVFDKYKNFFQYSKDEIIRERAIELDHVKRRLLSILRHQGMFVPAARDAIIVAQILTPTELINFKDNGIQAIVTEVGGIASHTSILARSFEIPAVIGVKDATKIISHGETIIVDGYTGTIVYNPKKTAISKYILRKREEQANREELGSYVKVKAQTSDGARVKIMANVDVIEDIHSAQMVGAEGAGLVRSEGQIIRLNRIPGFEEQLKWYLEIAESAFPEYVTIRAFDIGSDKFSEGIPHHENNPALGFRGIRYLLSRRDVFRNQIKAVLMASKNKNIKFMLPMVTSVKEVTESRTLIESVKKELSADEIPFDREMPVGVMIETPVAVMIADKLAKVSDFFSIGTNDLTQYGIAADRTNEMISEYYDPFHPGLLKLIKQSVKQAGKAKIPVSICGELASHAAALPLLIGMGFTELSVSPSIVLDLKRRVQSVSHAESIELFQKAIEMESSEEILHLLEQE
jgi:phosphotransferase system enzyme I (PtsI)